MSLAHLKNYGAAAKGTAAKTGGFMKLEDLPNAPYEFKIVGVRTRKLDWGTVFGIQLSPLSGNFKGITIDYDTPIYGSNGLDERGIGLLKTHLRTLGFDDEQWEEDLFFDRLEQAGSLMIGLDFRAMKTSNHSKKNNKTYHNIRFLDRLKDGRPATFTLADLSKAPPLPEAPIGNDAAAGTYVGEGGQPAAVGTNADIPF